ncbi:hypothetical protein ACRE_006800 [Hapsidospora chrysogenum ATCC 11550]|uniref:Protamine P1 n=1 Tax=Hapsidospora chrysogenum (strain ATCC 11550 / CBS 779.69 / DSM 880 / IAM 14645 / JCM 23072 / IMI 49137) TaxID=857340 RepID=A0A086TGU0_HAPC1|nr:hypothetical protein ACRE_006800 [Hapsidospora chrysogenum ATCC 11550]
MPATSPMPGGSGQHYGDTIYCEATCLPEEVYYQGSEDEYYENHSARRLRYEAAGRRFLDGDVPLILTATLRGPFGRDSGWDNPWRSGQHVPQRGTTSTAQGASKVFKRPKGLQPEKRPTKTQDTPQCHLPSPQSLKQVSVERHSFLEDENIARVQHWRSGIQPFETKPDDIRAKPVTPSHRLPSSGRKRASGSDSPYKTPIKRRKTDATPLRSRSAAASSMRASPFSSSFRTLAGRNPTPTRNASYSMQDDDDELGAEDELTTEPRSSFTSSFRTGNPSPRRRSPKKAIWKPSSSDCVDSEDELAEDEAANLKAAATLSSPVSNRGATKRTTLGGLHPSAGPQRHPAQAIEAHEPQRVQSPYRLAQIQEDEETEDEGSTSSESIEQPSREVDMQQDDSLRVHVRANSDGTEGCKVAEPVGVRESSPLSSVSSSFDNTSWSGLSSIEEEDANDSDALGHTELERPDAGNSVTVNLSGKVAEDYQGETVGEEEENQVLLSGDGPDSDGFSELSEPSTVESDFDIQRMIAQDGPENTPAPEAAAVTAIAANIVSEVGGTQNERSEMGEASSFVSNGSESRAEEIDVPIGGADESMSLIRERRSTAPTTVNMTTANGAGIGDSQSTENLEAIMPAEAEHTNNFREPAATPPESGSTGLSLKSMLQRLVPVNPWRKSQSSQVESQTPTAMRDNVEVNLEDPEYVESNKAIPEDTVAEQCHETQNEAASEVPATYATAPDMHTMSSSQPNSEVDQRITHSISSPGGPLDGEEALESEQTRPCSDDQGESEELTHPLPGLPQQSTTLAAVSAGWLRATSPGIEKTPAEAQTSCLIGAAQAPISDEVAKPLTDICDRHEQTTGVNAYGTTPPRPSTPESQSLLQPFSAFMTPSPVHRARKMQRRKLRVSGGCLPTTQGILRSALKTPWTSDKPNRRVSWAPLPCEEAHEYGTVTGTRAASPPPLTAVEDLPTSKDAEFQGHFNAVARRANEAPVYVPPTASQETDDSRGPYAVAESFSAADEMRHAPSFGAPMEMMGVTSDDAGDDMDLTDKVFQDLEDLLRPWDLDAELEQARNEPAFDAIEIGV